MEITLMEVAKIWKQTEPLMLERASREELMDSGYSLELHHKFRQLVHDGVLEKPESLVNILSPIQQFYKTRVKTCEKALEKIATQREATDATVKTLFKHRANLTVEAIEAEREKTSFVYLETISRSKDSLHLINYVLGDPRLKQKNPALEGHALDF